MNINFENYFLNRFNLTRKEKAEFLERILHSTQEELVLSVKNRIFNNLNFKNYLECAKFLKKECVENSPSLENSYQILEKSIEVIDSLQNALKKETTSKEELKSIVSQLFENDSEIGKKFVKLSKRSPHLSIIREIWREIKAENAIRKLAIIESKLGNKSLFSKFSLEKKKDHLYHLHNLFKKNVIDGVGAMNLSSEMKKLAQVDLPEQTVDSFFRSKREIERNIVSEINLIKNNINNVQEILEFYKYIPKEIESIENLEHPNEVKRFFEAAGKINTNDPAFGLKLLKKIGKKDNNQLLMNLINQIPNINFTEQKVDIRFLEALILFHPSLLRIDIGEWTGEVSTLSIGSCHPTLAASILRQLPAATQNVHLSSQTLHMLKLDEKQRPILTQVKHLHIGPDPIELSLDELLDGFVKTFPNISTLDFPPLVLSELKDYSPLKSCWNDIWELLDLNIRANALNKYDERIRFTLYRSLLNGQGIERDTLHKLFTPCGYQEDFKVPREIFYLLDTLSLIGNDERVIFHVPTPTDTPYLLAAGIFDRCFSVSKNLNLANNPLLDDHSLIGFMHRRLGDFRNSEQISHLNLSRCERLTTKGIVKALSVPNNIEVINFSENLQLDDHLLKEFPWSHLKSLRKINLTGTHISQRAVEHLRKQRPELVVEWNEVQQCGDRLIQEKILSGELRERNKILLQKFWLTGILGPLSENSAFKIIHETQHYRIKAECIEWLSRSLTPTNVLSRYDHAVADDLPEVEQLCRRFIELLCHPSAHGFYSQMSASQQEQIREIVQMDAPIKARSNFHTFNVELPIRFNEEEKSFIAEEDWRSQLPKELHGEPESVILGLKPFNSVTFSNDFRSNLTFDEVDLSKVHSLKLQFNIIRKPINTYQAVAAGKISLDKEILLTDSTGQITDRLQVNSIILRSRSSYLFDLLAGPETAKIETTHPKTLKTVITALMRGETLTLNDCTLRGGIELLKEIGRLNLVDTLTRGEDLWESLIHIGKRSEGNGYNTDWIELITWARKNDNLDVSMACVYLFKNQYDFMERACITETDKQMLHKIASMPELNHFAQFWESYSRNLLLRLHDEY